MSQWNRVLLLNKICVQGSVAVYQSFSSWHSIKASDRHCFLVCFYMRLNHRWWPCKYCSDVIIILQF